MLIDNLGVNKMHGNKCIVKGRENNVTKKSMVDKTITRPCNILRVFMAE